MTRRDAWRQAWTETKGIAPELERIRRACDIYRRLVPERMESMDFQPKPWLRKGAR